MGPAPRTQDMARAASALSAVSDATFGPMRRRSRAELPWRHGARDPRPPRRERVQRPERLQRRPGAPRAAGSRRRVASRRVRSAPLLADDPIDLCVDERVRAHARDGRPRARRARRSAPRRARAERHPLRRATRAARSTSTASGRAPPGPPTPCPGGGESRGDAARRFAAGYRTLLARPEPTILVVDPRAPDPLRAQRVARAGSDRDRRAGRGVRAAPLLGRAARARRRDGSRPGPRRPSSPDDAAARRSSPPLWVGRWALRELASLVGRRWLPPSPPRDPLAAPAGPHARPVRLRRECRRWIPGTCASASSGRFASTS